MQTITIKASLGWEHVDSLIRFLADKGLSVEAVKPRDSEWVIKAWSNEKYPWRPAEVFPDLVNAEDFKGYV